MPLKCVAEVTPEYDIRVDARIKNKLHPGEKVRISIEPILEEDKQERLRRIEELKKISLKSRLGLCDKVIQREDAHDRMISRDL